MATEPWEWADNALHSFGVVMTADMADGPRLRVDVTAGDVVVRTLHLFEGRSRAALTPSHGSFDGRHYVTGPSGAELEYACGVVGISQGIPDSIASGRVVVPGDQITSTVSCEAGVTAADGAQLGPDTFILKPGDEREFGGLGPFAFSARDQASAYEGAALVVDVGGVLPYRHRSAGFESAPNTRSGPSFTGLQSVERGGATLRYRCWTHD